MFPESCQVVQYFLGNIIVMNTTNMIIAHLCTLGEVCDRVIGNKGEAACSI